MGWNLESLGSSSARPVGGPATASSAVSISVLLMKDGTRRLLNAIHFSVTGLGMHTFNQPIIKLEHFIAYLKPMNCT